MEFKTSMPFVTFTTKMMMMDVVATVEGATHGKDLPVKVITSCKNISVIYMLKGPCSLSYSGKTSQKANLPSEAVTNTSACGYPL